MGEYHNLDLKSNTFLLTDVFNNFLNIYLEIYRLDLAHFPSAKELAWQAFLKKSKVKLDLLLDTNISLLIEKGIKSVIQHAIQGYVKANNK